MIAALYVLLSWVMLMWGVAQPPLPVVIDDTRVTPDGPAGFASADRALDGTPLACHIWIDVTDPWAGRHLSGVLAHEFGHCLLFRFSYYGHFPWPGVMSDAETYDRPTADDLLGYHDIAARATGHGYTTPMLAAD